MLEPLLLGALPLPLSTGPGAARPDGTSEPAVLVPNRAVAQGLQRGLAERGLTLKPAGNTCQTPAQWLQRLTRLPLAMPLTELETEDWWKPLRQQPLPQALRLLLWLVLPSDWRQHSVLVHTAAQLRSHPALLSGQGG